MDEITGLWGCERVLGPEVRGKLSLEKVGAQWRAEIMDFEASAVPGDIMTFSFPGNRGELRVRRAAENNFIGHWIQPGGIVTGYSHATGIELARTGEGIWTGEVVPFDDRLALYLVIERQQNGDLTAYVRDPDANSGVFLRIERVEHDGNQVRVVSSRHGEITGRYDAESGTFSMKLPTYPVTLDFTRRGRDEAAGFYPRTSDGDRYVYRPPLATGDGWRTGSLQDAHIDSAPITALVEQIIGTQATGLRTPYIQGLLVARHGMLVLEEYFYGFHRDRPHDTRSATKSLTTALVGIAIDMGAQIGVNAPVRSLFPNYTEFAHDDQGKQAITVRHLLTMTSGLACDDNDDDSPGNEDTMQSQHEQPDWYKFTLDLPMAGEPGGETVYCTAGINLLGGVISHATSQWLPDFFRENFAKPLDFGRYYLQLMPPPLRDMYLGGGHYLLPRDQMKLGQLYLDGGRWNGRQVVSKEWVDSSLQAHSHFPDHDYGYGWHLGEYSVGGRTYRRVEANGNGGQLVIIIPDLDMVVQFTAANYANYPTWAKFRDELVPQFIIPAAIR
jgi:CubicO group peptidase (beta-lactamase class C family)